MSIKGRNNNYKFKGKNVKTLNLEIPEIKVSNISIPFFKFSPRNHNHNFIPKDYIHLEILKKEISRL